MSAPLVSAIIAVYNGERCVARAIDSALAQRIESLEVVVVDDGSRDGTARVLAGYGDRIRVIRKEKNRGLATARNIAVDHARGHFLAFLDADDEWLPGRLEKTIAALETHPTTSMAFSDVVPIGRNGVALAPTYLHPGMARPPLMENLMEEGGWPILPSTVTLRRWVFDRVGGQAEEFRGAGGFDDADLWFLLRELGDFAFVPEPLARYRLTPFVERMRKYAAGFRVFTQRMRKRYGEPGDRMVRRSAALYRWLLTVKGLRCLEAGDMREARSALRCVLRYQPDVSSLQMRHQVRAVMAAQPTDENGKRPALQRDDVLRAWYAMLPYRAALAAMRRKGLLQIPPPPPSHVGFAEELLAGREPLALY